MKRIIACIIAVFAIATASAQQKGDMYVGGNLGFGVSSQFVPTSTSTTTAFTINPEFGGFVANNLELGFSIEYGLEATKYKSDWMPAPTATAHALSITPNLSYYAKLGENFYYTPGIAIGFAGAFSEGDILPGMVMNFELGSFEYRPKPKFGLRFSVLNLTYTMLNDMGTAYQGVNFQLAGSSSIGVRYYF